MFIPGLTGIVGVNGSGKSTLLKTIAGLHAPLNGKIEYNGKRIDNSSPSEIAHIISIVLTERISAPYLTVFDLVASGRSPHTGFSGKLSDNDIGITNRYIRECGISHLAEKFSDEISDGERQKCMLARALAQETPVLLLDEPTSYLDFRARYEIMELIRKICITEGKIVIFSSHDLEIVFKSASRCVVFLNDKIIVEETSALIASDIPQQLLEGTSLQFDKGTMTINYRKGNI